MNSFPTTQLEETDNVQEYQMVATLFIILHKIFPVRAVLKIKQYLSFSREMFRHVMRLDQSPASENIWWIIANINIFVVFLFSFHFTFFLHLGGIF